MGERDRLQQEQQLLVATGKVLRVGIIKISLL
jgi:hypothetical protein